MRSSLETYKVWAPDHALWTQWAKPVSFIHHPGFIENFMLDIPEIKWIQSVDKRAVIIVDLPGHVGVGEALALARLGYRPVPLYNGVSAQSSLAVVNVDDIVKALYTGADELSTYHMPPGAPPVFMLDSNRMTGYGKQPGQYDNRWCVFPQDFPSAALLLKEGFSKVIVRSDSIRNDLSHILRRYQEEGIDIYLCSGEETKKMSVVKPSKFKSLSYRFNVILGLTRNAAGGFGGLIPEPERSGASGRVYRYG
jgi:hypothetical protein